MTTTPRTARECKLKEERVRESAKECFERARQAQKSDRYYSTPVDLESIKLAKLQIELNALKAKYIQLAEFVHENLDDEISEHAKLQVISPSPEELEEWKLSASVPDEIADIQEERPW